MGGRVSAREGNNALSGVSPGGRKRTGERLFHPFYKTLSAGVELRAHRPFSCLDKSKGRERANAGETREDEPAERRFSLLLELDFKQGTSEEEYKHINNTRNTHS